MKKQCITLLNLVSSSKSEETMKPSDVNHQKVFDTVDHSILLSKLHHYGKCGLVVNKWFQSYLADHMVLCQISQELPVARHKDFCWGPYFFQ